MGTLRCGEPRVHGYPCRHTEAAPDPREIGRTPTAVVTQAGALRALSSTAPRTEQRGVPAGLSGHSQDELGVAIFAAGTTALVGDVFSLSRSPQAGQQPSPALHTRCVTSALCLGLFVDKTEPLASRVMKTPLIQDRTKPMVERAARGRKEGAVPALARPRG